MCLAIIKCIPEYSCEINGIVYQFYTSNQGSSARIISYPLHLSAKARKAENDSFVVA